MIINQIIQALLDLVVLTTTELKTSLCVLFFFYIKMNIFLTIFNAVRVFSCSCCHEYKENFHLACPQALEILLASYLFLPKIGQLLISDELTYNISSNSFSNWFRFFVRICTWPRICILMNWEMIVHRIPKTDIFYRNTGSFFSRCSNSVKFNESVLSLRSLSNTWIQISPHSIEMEAIFIEPIGCRQRFSATSVKLATL